MKKMNSILLSLFIAICVNAQSLKGQWASLQPIDNQPAYLILQFEEKDSVGIGVLFEKEESGIKVRITSTCDGLYDADGEVIDINYIDSTLKTSCDIDLPEEVKSQMKEETRNELDMLKKQLADVIQSKFKQILPLMRALEIISLTDNELKVTTGNFEMIFQKIGQEESSEKRKEEQAP